MIPFLPLYLLLNLIQELTTWVNSLLQQKDTTLDCDLKKAISDGRTLPILLDVMGGKYHEMGVGGKYHEVGGKMGGKMWTVRFLIKPP